MSDFQKHLQESMNDPAFAKAYEALDAQYSFARQVIAARLEKGMTQKELADAIGTSQANISKIEHASFNPSIEMAQRVAAGLGKQLYITLQ